MRHVIDDELRKLLDRLERTTALGQVIDSEATIKNFQSYPLRFHLRQLSRYIWYDLLKEGKREQDILHAVNVVKREFAAYLSASDMAYDEEDAGIRYCRDVAAEFLADHWDVQQRMRSSEESDAEPRVSPLGRWYINSDPTIGLELVEDDWLQNKELWQVAQDWTWAHVYDFLALLTIDSALEPRLPMRHRGTWCRCSALLEGPSTTVAR
jgi:hypothetical protein